MPVTKLAGLLLAAVVTSAAAAQQKSAPLVEAQPDRRSAATHEPRLQAGGNHSAYLPVVGRFDRSDLRSDESDTWEHYGHTNLINDVAVDPRTGMVWAATGGGLVRWDPESGERERYSLQSLEFVALDGSGPVWVATQRGADDIVSALGSDGTWREFGPAEGLPKGRLESIESDHTGGVWVGLSTVHWRGGVPQDGALVRISRDGEIETWDMSDGWPNQSVALMVSDHAGGVWFTLWDYESPASIGHIEQSGDFDLWGPQDGLPSEGIVVEAVAPDGSLYAIDRASGLGAAYRRDPEGGWHFVDLAAEFDYRELPWHLAVGPDGTLYVIPDSAFEMLIVSPNGQSRVFPDRGVDDPSSYVFDDILMGYRGMAFGRDGSAWFAAEGDSGGLVRLLPSLSVRLYPDRFGSTPARVDHVEVDDRRIWLTGGRGLSEITMNGARTTIHRSSGGGLFGRNTLAIDTRANTWVVTNRGPLRIDPDGHRTAFTSDDGLPNAYSFSKVFALPDGTVWVGSRFGASLLGGDHRWTTLTITDGLGSNNVAEVVPGVGGETWIATTAAYRYENGEELLDRSGGLSRLGADGAIQTFTHAGLTEPWIAAAAVEPDGAVWVGSGNRLLRLTASRDWIEERLPAVAADSQVWALAVDEDSNLWVGTRENGLHRRAPNGAWTSWGIADGLPGEWIRDILVDRDGEVWIAAGSSEAGDDLGAILRLNGDGSWTTFQFPSDPLLGRSRMIEPISLAVDAEGRLVVANAYHNHHKRLEPDGRFTTLVFDHELPPGQVDDIDLDHIGGAWVASPGGVSHWTPDDQWRTYNTGDGLAAGSARALAVDESGDAWVGLSPAWDQATESWLTTGVAQVGLSGGVSNLSLQEAASLGEGVHALARTETAGLWVARHHLVWDQPFWEPVGTGVSHRDPAGNWTSYGPSDFAGLDDVRALAMEANGTAWFATGRGLVSHSDGAGWELADTGTSTTNFTTVEIDPHGLVWAGSDVGAHRRSPDGHWTTWTEADGLSDNSVNDFAFDARGRTWVATLAGGITVMPRLGP